MANLFNPELLYRCPGLNAQRMKENYQVKNIEEITLKEFASLSSGKKPVVTGGTLIISCASLASTLILMSLQLSRAKIRKIEIKELLSENLRELESLKSQLANQAGQDLQLFDSFRSLKVKVKSAERDELLWKATESPLRAAELMQRILSLTFGTLNYCKKNLLSDFGAGVEILYASFKSILLIAQGNINSLPEDQQVDFQQQKNKLGFEGEKLASSLISLLNKNQSKIKT